MNASNSMNVRKLATLGHQWRWQNESWWRWQSHSDWGLSAHHIFSLTGLQILMTEYQWQRYWRQWRCRAMGKTCSLGLSLLKTIDPTGPHPPGNVFRLFLSFNSILHMGWNTSFLRWTVDMHDYTDRNVGPSANEKRYWNYVQNVSHSSKE